VSYLKIENVSKKYNDGSFSLEVLHLINLSIEKGQVIALIGESGCGKSTLLNLIMGLIKATRGHIYFNDKDINAFSYKEMVKFRKEKIAVIFQEYNLFKILNIQDNLEVVEEEKLIKKDLKQAGLNQDIKMKVSKLSGGEQQRIAVLRGVLKKSELILADEPTGALDEENSELVLKYLTKLNNKTIIFVSHNLEMAKKYCSRIIILKDGMIESDELRELKREKNYIIQKETKTEKTVAKHIFKEIIKNRGKFLVSFLSTLISLVFTYLLLISIFGLKDYLLGSYNEVANCNVFNVESYQRDSNNKQEIPQEVIKELNKYDLEMRENIDEGLNNLFLNRFRFESKKVARYSVSCLSKQYQQKYLLTGRLPLNSNEIIVNESLLKEIDVKQNKSLNKKIVCDFVTTYANFYKIIIKKEYRIVGVSKDGMIQKEPKIYFNYQETENFLKEDVSAGKSLYEIIKTNKLQIDLNKISDVLKTTQKIKESKYYLKADKYLNYNFVLLDNGGLQDYLLYASITNSIEIVLGFFLLIVMAITFILILSISFSFVQELQKEISIFKLLGSANLATSIYAGCISSFIVLPPFIASFLLTFLLAKGVEVLSLKYYQINIGIQTFLSSSNVLFLYIILAMSIYVVDFLVVFVNIKGLNLQKALKR
jgi:putative ABC transport system ATP-binding protein